VIINLVIIVAAETGSMEFAIKDWLELHSFSLRLVFVARYIPYLYPRTYWQPLSAAIVRACED